MCIQQNYTPESIVFYLHDDSNHIANNIAYYSDNDIHQNNHINHPYTIINDYNPHHLSVMYFENLQIFDELHNRYKNNDVYKNLQYILGTLVSLYGIYYFVVRSVEYVYKKK